MDGSEVAIAALALAGTAMGGIIWIVKYFAKTLSHDLKEHTKAALKQQIASDKLRTTVEIVGKQGVEHHKFMKALNGKLSAATIQTVNEQNVKHQTVEMVEKKP